jgi:hypothetical protein
MLREQLKPPYGGVFLEFVVIKSHGGSDAEGFADAINLGKNGAPRIALQDQADNSICG